MSRLESTVTYVKDPRVLKLLERMLDGAIEEIKPVLDPTSKTAFRYANIDDILEARSEDTFEILEKLADEGILTKRFHDKLFACPKCKSFQLRPGTQCSKCSSANITRGKVIEHYVCGYVGLEREFETEKGYICPKCKKELKLIGTDYRSPEIALYKCDNCGETFNDPVESWHCLDCLEYFPKNEAIEAKVYSYRLNETKRDWLRVQLKPKRKIEEYLTNEGYSVQSSIKIRGTSGVEHEIDTFALKKSGIFEHKIVIGISTGAGGKEVGPEDVLKLFAKAYDVGAHDIILIAIPKLGEEAKHFAQYYRIRTLEAEDLEKAVEQLKPTS